MVIRPLDDRTHCTRSTFTHLRLWRKLYNCSWHHITANHLKVWLFDRRLMGKWGLGVGLFDSPPGYIFLSLFHPQRRQKNTNQVKQRWKLVANYCEDKQSRFGHLIHKHLMGLCCELESFHMGLGFNSSHLTHRPMVYSCPSYVAGPSNSDTMTITALQKWLLCRVAKMAYKTSRMIRVTPAKTAWRPLQHVSVFQRTTGPTVWNSLPNELRTFSLETFGKRLKVYIGTLTVAFAIYPVYITFSTVIYSMISGNVSWRQTWPNHDNLPSLTANRKNSWRLWLGAARKSPRMW